MKENINIRIGKRIRLLRQHRGLSQEELAEISGLHRSHMGELERGELNITLVTLERVAASLRIPLRQIVDHGGRR